VIALLLLRLSVFVFIQQERRKERIGKERKGNDRKGKKERKTGDLGGPLCALVFVFFGVLAECFLGIGWDEVGRACTPAEGHVSLFLHDWAGE
jgi:hypothetical protein